MKRGWVSVLTAAVLIAPACSTNGLLQSNTPTCALRNNLSVLVLQAQAVPSADRVPCVRLVPAGWNVAEADIKSGRARFTMANDRAGNRAVQVFLTRRCDTNGATSIPTDEPGTERFERVDSIQPTYQGSRFYTFAGGCAEYRFRFERGGPALVNEASLALTFVTRSTIDRASRREASGR